MMNHLENGIFIGPWERSDIYLGLFQLWKSRANNLRSMESQDTSAYDGRTATTFRRSVHVSRQQTGDAARILTDMFATPSDRDRTHRGLLGMLEQTRRHTASTSAIEPVSDGGSSVAPGSQTE
jgi:hypothetical protein